MHFCRMEAAMFKVFLCCLATSSAFEFFTLEKETTETSHNDSSTATPDQTSWTCPKGWVANDVSEVFSCLSLETEARTFQAAQLHCQDLGGDLVSLRGARKERFVKSLTKDTTDYWIGLSKGAGYSDSFHWHDFQDGKTEAKPQDLSQPVRDFYGYSERCGYISSYEGEVQTEDCDNEYASICETAISCKPGWFGHRCERECHCYGELCDPRPSAGPDTVTCRWGCQRNWMGTACDVKKQDPEVKYFCINSPEKSGKYVHINIYNIYTGLQYRAVYGLNASQVEGAWCNSTTVESRGNSFLAIHIPLDDDTVESMKSGQCVGQQVDTDTFTWIIAIKENRGILMEHDLLVNITCDFSTADRLIRSDSYLLEGESQDVHKETVTAESLSGDVVLEVINPQGKPVSEAAIGSTILLQMSFGLNKGSLLKGIFPKSCQAFASGDKNIKLLDENGCSPPESPLQPFVLARNKTLTTPWFHMFAFENERTVTFMCSFELCFSDECPVGCRQPSRKKRDVLTPTEEAPASSTRTIRVLPSISSQHNPGDHHSSHHPQNPDPGHMGHNPGLLVYLNPVTCSLFLLVLLVFLCMYITFLRTLKKSVNDIRREIQIRRSRDKFLHCGCVQQKDRDYITP